MQQYCGISRGYIPGNILGTCRSIRKLRRCGIMRVSGWRSVVQTARHRSIGTGKRQQLLQRVNSGDSQCLIHGWNWARSRTRRLPLRVVAVVHRSTVTARRCASAVYML